MTRQQRWQIKMVRDGKCRICGAPAVTKFLCEKHRLAANTRMREAMHKRNRRSAATPVPNTLAATMQRRSFTFLNGCSRSRLCCNITRRPGTFFACCLKARTHRSALANPSRKLQSARCARQGTSPKPFTRVRGQAEVGNAFAITSTREKRPEKGLFPPARLRSPTHPASRGTMRQRWDEFCKGLERAREAA